ncbi:MAG: c-type cytochrome [Vicinamibacteraceae bacterium]|nr:c-type cytochrome [Vicinamibacteraceae bacterium]
MSKERLCAALLVAASAGVLTLTVGCQATPPAPAPSALQASSAGVGADVVARGEYLVLVGGCNDCHTPFKMGPKGPEPDIDRLLSGHPEALVMPPAPEGDAWLWHGSGTNTAFAGPWGVSYAINLTPDDTGLGPWTEEVFLAAMKTQRHMGVGRPILPPMPVANYGRMTDADLKAIYAYLRTVKPLRNKVPEAVVAPPPAAPAP